MIGVNEGNGHPYSFSAIVNGFDDQAFAQAGWPVIRDYLRARSPSDFGVGNARVTHAWTQDPDTTDRLCAACAIPHACAVPEDMTDAVDAVVIARDDWQSHRMLAAPFLERGIPVLVDKPLSLSPADLDWFAPHLEAGKLMSTSGLRYARELDPLRRPRAEWPTGAPRLINATVLNDLSHYGVHMLDALAGIGIAPGPNSRIEHFDLPHQGVMIRTEGQPPILLNCLGAVAKTFHIDVFGEQSHCHFDLHDNFTAFRRLLTAFIGMVETGIPPIAPSEIRTIMTIIAADAPAR